MGKVEVMGGVTGEEKEKRRGKFWKEEVEKRGRRRGKVLNLIEKELKRRKVLEVREKGMGEGRRGEIRGRESGRKGGKRERRERREEREREEGEILGIVGEGEPKRRGRETGVLREEGGFTETRGSEESDEAKGVRGEKREKERALNFVREWDGDGVIERFWHVCILAMECFGGCLIQQICSVGHAA